MGGSLVGPAGFDSSPPTSEAVVSPELPEQPHRAAATSASTNPAAFMRAPRPPPRGALLAPIGAPSIVCNEHFPLISSAPSAHQLGHGGIQPPQREGVH